MQALGLPRVTDNYLPRKAKEWQDLTAEVAETRLAALREAMAPHLVLAATELENLHLARLNIKNYLPKICVDYKDELKQARLSVVPAGEDGLSALRVIGMFLRDANTLSEREDEGVQGGAVEQIAEALALLLKVYLVADFKGLRDEDIFKEKYNKHRNLRDGHFPIGNHQLFLRNLAVSGKHVTVDQKLLAVVGGFLGVDFMLLRVRRDSTELNNAASTTLLTIDIDADPEALDFRFGLGAAKLNQARPVIPLLETVEVGHCVYRGLRPHNAVLQQPGSQMTNWRSADDLRVWLPAPASRSVLLYKLRDVYYEAGGVVWTVVRTGRTTLVLQMKRRECTNSTVLVTDPFYVDLPVAEIVPGSDGKVVRSLQQGPEEPNEWLGQGHMEGPQCSTFLPPPLPLASPSNHVQEQHQGQNQPPQQPQAEQLQASQPEMQQQQQLEPQPLDSASTAAAAHLEATLWAARCIRNCEDIDFLAKDEAGRAPSHISAKETAKALLDRATEVETTRLSQPMLHLAVVSGGGVGKTTFVNRTLAELMATREKLRRFLPEELWGAVVQPTTVSDFLRLCNVVEGVLPAATAAENMSSTASPPCCFSATFKPLPVTDGLVDPRFKVGGEFDYFDLGRHCVAEEVQSYLSRSWDEGPHIDLIDDMYNLCKPRVRGEEYGCFLPNGKDMHCTDRVQHVYMPVADSLEAAAFRFCLKLISRESTNKKIHQYRRYIRGEISYGELGSEAYFIVPYMCGLKGAGEENERIEKLIDKATNNDADEDCDSEGAVDGGIKEASRNTARQELLQRLYPLKRYECWLGLEVEFRLYSDDPAHASQWAEFFSTRFILGRENAAFTLSGGSAMYVPAEMLPLHIMDLPGVVEEKDHANALQAAEAEAGLRAISAHAGQGHTVIVLPTTDRNNSRQQVFSKLHETRVLQAAVNNLSDFTLVPLINLKPDSNCVLGRMQRARSGHEFASSYARAGEPHVYIGRFKQALLDAATCMEAHKPGTKDCLQQALDAEKLLRPFALDVSGLLVEEKPFHNDPEVVPFLFSTFTTFLVNTQLSNAEEARCAACTGMWEQLGGMLFEGVGLAKRLQPGHERPQGGHDSESIPSDVDDEEVVSPSNSLLNLGKVEKALREALSLQQDLSVGDRNWVAEVSMSLSAAAGPSMPSPGAAVATDSLVPLSVDQIPAWVERSALRRLMDECTSHLAKERLNETEWGAAYKAMYNRLLGKDLASNNLKSTNLPDFLISKFKEKCEGIMAVMLEEFINAVMEADVKLVQAQIHKARKTIESNKDLLRDTEVQLLLDVFEESIAEAFKRKIAEVLARYKILTKTSTSTVDASVPTVDKDLTARWHDAINNERVLKVADTIYRQQKTREKRLEKARTELLEAWKASLMPAAAGTNEVGLVACIIMDLGHNLLSMYRRLRSQVIREAMKAAKSSTVSTLGPMALRVVSGGVRAAHITMDVAASPAASLASESLLKELQDGLRTAKEVKKARIQVLCKEYKMDDPLELVHAVLDDDSLRQWLAEMSVPPPETHKSSSGRKRKWGRLAEPARP